MTRPSPDFDPDVLRDLYGYRLKRTWLARMLWLGLGIFGGHRFYLERHATGLLMLLTGGGFMVWWVVDGFRVGRMARDHNGEQRRRQAAGEPPLELDFMPALTDDVLDEPPAWAERWRDPGRARMGLRLTGDVLVLLIAGMGVGALAREAGVWEAVLAVLALVAVTAAGGAVGRAAELPLLSELIRWSHRVRLFYWVDGPAHPLALMARPVTALLTAPFRRRDRAEARLYLELGGVFTLAFLLLDLAQALGEQGLAALGGGALTELWVEESLVTFLTIYGFATPIGAILTLHLLTRETHRVPRALSTFTLLAVVLGLVAA